MPILDIPHNTNQIGGGKLNLVESGYAGEDLSFGDMVIYDPSAKTWGLPTTADGEEGTFGVVLEDSTKDNFAMGDAIAVTLIGPVVVSADETITEGVTVASSTLGKVQDYDTLSIKTEAKKIGKAKTSAGASGGKIIVNML